MHNSQGNTTKDIEDSKKEFKNLNKNDDTWLREKGPRSRSGLRLFGPRNPKQKQQLIQDLQWWVPDRLHELLEVIPGTDSDLVVDDIRLVGCRDNYTAAGGHASDNKRPTKHFFRQSECQAENFRTQQAMEEESIENKDSPAGERILPCGDVGATLALQGHDEWEVWYAKDLLFSFMCSVAKTLQRPVEGVTETRPAVSGNSDNWRSVILWKKIYRETRTPGRGKRVRILTRSLAWYYIVPQHGRKATISPSALRFGAVTSCRKKKNRWHRGSKRCIPVALAALSGVQ